jgi:hypothetical protein
MKADSIEGIYETLKNCALISKSAGGIGTTRISLHYSHTHIERERERERENHNS